MQPPQKTIEVAHVQEGNFRPPVTTVLPSHLTQEIEFNLTIGDGACAVTHLGRRHTVPSEDGKRSVFQRGTDTMD